MSYFDSSGLGALLVSRYPPIKQDLCILQFVNMTPRLLELMHNLTSRSFCPPNPVL